MSPEKEMTENESITKLPDFWLDMGSNITWDKNLLKSSYLHRNEGVEEFGEKTKIDSTEFMHSTLRLSRLGMSIFDLLKNG